jgi:glutamate--cysteine ligase catalytic subunit
VIRLRIVADMSVPAKPGPTTPYIKMDAMAFGMGCCCLQITFQAWNVNEARRVYDALVPVAPIMVCPPVSTPEVVLTNSLL